MANVGDILVDRYRLDGRIGAGGFATVFKARDLRLDREVAVKVLSAHYLEDPVVVVRFDREARALAAFSHPNVVAIHDVEPAEPTLGAETFLVMDLCDGGSLATHIAAAEGRGLAPDALVPLLIDVAAGLDALHAAGMVHRDVKPSNVLLLGGRALIADLGIAAAVPGEITGSGDAMGTLAYLAPEQLAGTPATPASDVHALGVVAYLGLSGRLPRPASSIAELVAASSTDPPLVSSLVDGLGTMFDRPLATALARDPEARPTVQQFAWRLERGLERWQETAALSRTRLTDSTGVAAAIATGITTTPGGGGASPPASSSASEPSPDDPTVIGGGRPTTKPLVEAPMPPSPMAGRSSDERVDQGTPAIWHRPMRLAAGVALTAVLLAALLLALSSTRDDGQSPVGIAVEPTATADRTTPSAVASQPASPRVATESPARPDGYTLSLEASRAMRAAVAAARGKSGLNGHEAKDLVAMLDRFDRAIGDRDADAARSLASSMVEVVRELVERNEVSSEAGGRLQAAADDVLTSAEALD